MSMSEFDRLVHEACREKSVEKVVLKLEEALIVNGPVPPHVRIKRLRKVVRVGGIITIMVAMNEGQAYIAALQAELASETYEKRQRERSGDQ